MPYLDTITIVCIGLMVGTEFAVSAFINPALRKFAQQILPSVRAGLRLAQMLPGASGA